MFIFLFSTTTAVSASHRHWHVVSHTITWNRALIDHLNSLIYIEVNQLNRFSNGWREDLFISSPFKTVKVVCFCWLLIIKMSEKQNQQECKEQKILNRIELHFIIFWFLKVQTTFHREQNAQLPLLNENKRAITAVVSFVENQERIISAISLEICLFVAKENKQHWAKYCFDQNLIK